MLASLLLDIFIVVTVVGAVAVVGVCVMIAVIVLRNPPGGNPRN